MKISSIFFHNLYLSVITISTFVVAQNDETCGSNKVYQCPDPSGTNYPNKFDNYANQVSLSTGEAPMDEWDVALSAFHLTSSIVGGFFPWYNSAYQLSMFALGYTSLLEEDDNFQMRQVETALNNIVKNFNEQIDSVYDYIDERYDDLTNWTEELVSSSDYLNTLENERRYFLTSLGDYNHSLTRNGFDETTTVDDIPRHVIDDMEEHLDDATNWCQSFFGSTSIAYGGIPVTPLLDRAEQLAKYRLVNVQEMCSGCLNVYSSLYALKNDNLHLEDLEFTLERCMLDVIPLVREHVQDEIDLVTFDGEMEDGDKAGGEYDGSPYFGFTKIEHYHKQYYQCQECGFVGGTWMCYSSLCDNEYNWKCHSTCDRIQSCTNNEFADYVDYLCTEQTNSRQDWCPDSGEYVGAYPEEIAGACVGFGKKRIDDELMNFYRSSIFHGYGDIWAQTLAAVNPQALILSSDVPVSYGPFAIQSRHWGMFLNVAYSLEIQMTYFNFIWTEGNNYQIQSESGSNLCDGINCEWTMIPMTSTGTVDATLYAFQNTATGHFLAPSLDADYTQTGGNKFQDNAEILVSTTNSNFDLAFTFRIIRKCDTPGYCKECQVDSDCHGNRYLYCDTTEYICAPKVSPAFTSKDDLVAAVNDVDGSFDTYGTIDGWDVSQIDNFDSLFEGMTSFNEDISKWDMSAATSMTKMFYQAESFNQDIRNWDTSSATSLYGMFWEATSFDQKIGGWNVAKVTDIGSMFQSASSFNQDISGWVTTSCQNMRKAFANSAFNQDIRAWDTSSVTSMHGMFHNTPFNQYIGNWEVSKVEYMSSMFKKSNFNQDISGWKVGNVVEMNQVFFQNTDFNQNIGGWNTGKVTSMAMMFMSATAFNQDIANWNVASLTGTNAVNSMFSGAHSMNHVFCWEGTLDASVDVDSIGTNLYCAPTYSAFTSKDDLVAAVNDVDGAFDTYGPIARWDVSQIENFDYLFKSLSTFNEDITKWDTSSATSMHGMFMGATSFDQKIGGWNVEKVTDIGLMFYKASSFNQDISGWVTTSCQNMRKAFENSAFNQDIHAWDTSSVTSMHGMFSNTPFNQDIGNWEVSKVKHMSSMFKKSKFNQDIGGWKVWNVVDMNQVFYQNTDFNQDISGWKTGKVTTMTSMFQFATAFNQNIGDWNVASLRGTNAVKWMFYGADSMNHEFCWEGTLDASVEVDSIGTELYCP